LSAIRVGHLLRQTFLLWYLRSIENEIASRGTGTTFSSISGDSLRKTHVSVPSKQEQDEIVRILEEQLSRLEAATAAIAAVRSKADQFRRSALHNDLKRLPSSCLRLDECAALTLGLMLDRGRETGKFQTPYLGNINVRWGSFDITALKTMDIRPEQMERSSARAGDIVVCEGGEPGRCAIWRESEPIAIQKALHRVRPNLRFLADYLALILESEFRGRRQHVLFTGTTIKHLPKERLRLVEVPDIALDEQERVVTGFRKVDDSVARTEAHCRQIEIGLIAVRRALMHAAFTGELTKEWREKNNG
jgi:type I restriction enzyme S subunit